MTLWGSSTVQNTSKGWKMSSLCSEACVILMLNPGKIAQEKKIIASFTCEHTCKDPK